MQDPREVTFNTMRRVPPRGGPGSDAAGAEWERPDSDHGPAENSLAEQLKADGLTLLGLRPSHLYKERAEPSGALKRPPSLSASS